MTVETKTREKQKVTTDSGSSGGGMDMMSGFTTLGTKIHEDSLESMQYFQDLEAARRERERQQKLDNFQMKQTGIENAQQNRAQNMEGLNFLAGQRLGAQTMANRRPSFRDALANSLRGA
jgi:hypothetical protein